MTLGARLIALLDDPAAREQVAAMPDLDVTLADQLADARATWPGVELADDTYLHHVATAVRERAAESSERVLRTLPAADVYLAAGCAAGDARALAAFRAALVPPLRDLLGRLGATPAALDEIEQRVLELLFVAEPGGRAQIATYTGRGRLRSWLRSVGVRTGRRMLGLASTPPADDVDRLPHAVDDPQLEFLRAEYAGPFRSAFKAALAGLSERQRNLLRQYHIDELTIDELGALYHVNRATAARWVVSARATLLDATRAQLATDLAIPSSEVDSIIRLVRSRIDLSLRTLF